MAYSRIHRAYCGDLCVSVAVGPLDRCKPQVAGLELDQYEWVEVALVSSNGLEAPEMVGVDGYDGWFGEPVAMDQAELHAFIDAVASAQGVTAPQLLPAEIGTDPFPGRKATSSTATRR